MLRRLGVRRFLGPWRRHSPGDKEMRPFVRYWHKGAHFVGLAVRNYRFCSRLRLMMISTMHSMNPMAQIGPAVLIAALMNAPDRTSGVL